MKTSAWTLSILLTTCCAFPAVAQVSAQGKNHDNQTASMLNYVPATQQQTMVNAGGKNHEVPSLRQAKVAVLGTPAKATHGGNNHLTSLKQHVENAIQRTVESHQKPAADGTCAQEQCAQLAVDKQIWLEEQLQQIRDTQDNTASFDTHPELLQKLCASPFEKEANCTPDQGNFDQAKPQNTYRDYPPVWAKKVGIL